MPFHATMRHATTATHLPRSDFQAFKPREYRGSINRPSKRMYDRYGMCKESYVNVCTNCIYTAVPTTLCSSASPRCC